MRPDSPSTLSSRAFLLMTMRRFDECIAEAKRAEELNPTSAGVATTVGYAYFAAERFADSIKSLKQAMDPEFAFARALGIHRQRRSRGRRSACGRHGSVLKGRNGRYTRSACGH